jgi:hypothetical protein
MSKEIQGKSCRKCGEWKPLSSYYNNKRTSDGKTSACKACMSKQHKAWYRANKEKKSRINREYRENAPPCVYRIKHKETGVYYLGSTNIAFPMRVAQHFCARASTDSPLTGHNKDDYHIEVLAYFGTKKEAWEAEMNLLRTRIGKDELCLNKRLV